MVKNAAFMMLLSLIIVTTAHAKTCRDIIWDIACTSQDVVIGQSFDTVNTNLLDPWEPHPQSLAGNGCEDGCKEDYDSEYVCSITGRGSSEDTGSFVCFDTCLKCVPETQVIICTTCGEK